MEYFLHFWGGASPYIEKELGIKDHYFWFDSEEKRETFIAKLMSFDKYGLALERKESKNFTHKHTIAKLILIYKGKEYFLEYDFGYEYSAESAIFMFKEGNYSCDCNKSDFIRQQCDKNFPELDCGDEIEIKNIEIIYIA